MTREFVAALSAAMGRKIAAADPGGRRLPTLARALHAAFAAPDTAAAAGVLNELMRRYRSRPYLTEDVGQPFHLHFHGEAANAVDSLGGEFATALALVIDAYGHKRFGLCQAHACDRAYVDLTRNGSRRYCSEACTARAKMAAYRERKSGA
ncbi:CGNR zinc finger domain-containing protein [Pseudomonas sp. CGJS7]|uniref:CGNR zinc finger domain-containing protein n=1 Tax=Pseudomonas sp. CGJS7 TaxID=3109348 RepID=UPI003009C94B